MNSLTLYAMILLAAFFGGGAAGLAGCFTVGLRMPFLAVCMAHAGMAGAVLALLLGFPVAVGTFGGAMVGTGLLFALLREPENSEGAAVGLIFSLMLGLAFLGIGLAPGPKTAVLNLMWGTLLFVSPGDVAMMGGVLALLIGFAVWRHADMKLLLFNRSLAATIVDERLWFAILMILSAAVIAVNIQTVGGLLLYSLVCNPAMAAGRLARSFRGYLTLGGLFGAGCALAGFGVAWALDLPTGACIVIVSSLLVAVAVGLARHMEK